MRRDMLSHWYHWPSICAYAVISAVKSETASLDVQKTEYLCKNSFWPKSIFHMFFPRAYRLGCFFRLRHYVMRAKNYTRETICGVFMAQELNIWTVNSQQWHAIKSSAAFSVSKSSQGRGIIVHLTFCDFRQLWHAWNLAAVLKCSATAVWWHHEM